jgi:nitric oxide reductase subunit C
MSEVFTKSMAKNIYFVGSVFFILLFLALTFDTSGKTPQRDDHEAISAQVALGKRVWEERDCIGCRTLLGEGGWLAALAAIEAE